MSRADLADAVTIRTLAPGEIGLAVEWAAAEGWNPGRGDQASFALVDPGGFHVAELDGASAATLSVVNYDDRFAFLGFYIVRPDLRGRGIGLRLWQHGIAHAGHRTIGLDGVVAQQANYARSGFTLSHRNIRFGGRAISGAGAAADATVPLASVAWAEIAASDAAVFPAPRDEFLRSWIGAPGREGRALRRDGRLAGWGVIRPAHSGFRVGPLVAEDAAAAAAVLAALVPAAGGEELFLDVPEPNAAALTLAASVGLTPVFETARMYRGPVRPVALDRIYGVTSFELG